MVGTAALALLVVAARLPVSPAPSWARSPWWHWIGGLLGAVYVVMTIVLAPRLGAATLMAAVVAGQMVASLALDHYGLVGFAQQPLTIPRLLGTLLVIGGVLLVRN